MPENRQDGKELFMAFQGVIKKNNEMRCERETLMLNIKDNFLTASA